MHQRLLWINGGGAVRSPDTASKNIIRRGGGGISDKTDIWDEFGDTKHQVVVFRSIRLERTNERVGRAVVFTKTNEITVVGELWWKKCRPSNRPRFLSAVRMDKKNEKALKRKRSDVDSDEFDENQENIETVGVLIITKCNLNFYS